MLAVLGRPGNGCTTLLKVLARQLSGIGPDDPLFSNYEGAHGGDIHSEFRSECIYTAKLYIYLLN